MTPQGQQAAQFVYQRLVSKGISPPYAAAAVGHLIEETGWFAPDVISGNRRGDSGTAAFLAQWRGPRLANLVRYARENNRPLDLATQVDFIVHEGEAGLDAGASRWLREARAGRGNLADGVAAFAHYERPAGYTAQNPGRIKTFDKRFSHANTVAQMVGGAGGPAGGFEMPEYLRGVAGDASAAPQQASAILGRSPADFLNSFGGPDPTRVGNVGVVSNTGYNPPSLDIDYGTYGIKTPDLSRGVTPNGQQYVRAFSDDPYLEGRA